jgi:hypothetical protein
LAAELAALQKVMLGQVWLAVQAVVDQVQEVLALVQQLLADQELQDKETLAEINQQIIIRLLVVAAQVQQAQMGLPTVAQVAQVQHPQLADLQ